MIERILVRGTNWIGDAVMTAPALERLRASFPRAHITLLAPPRTAELFEGVSYIDRTVVYRRQEGVGVFFEAAKRLRAERIDLAALFQNAFEAALLSWLAGARLRVGYAEQGRGPLLTHRLHRGPGHRNRHQVNDYLDIVAECERACAIEPPAVPDSARWPSLRASAAQVDASRPLLARLAAGHSSGAPGPLVALNAGATNSRAKCWPAERFAALADRLIERTNARIVMIGAGTERESAQAVLDRMGHGGGVNLAGETSMAELFGLLAACDLLVSNDTGPAHIAAALGRPTLTIFGPTNEFETSPTGPRAELLRADAIECARCMHRDCPIDHRCMTRISAEEVYARAIRLLG
ncbi:MAG: lipopolysaccharide heptosyltransferase II [Blastocatellia bacterium]|nr:lipopolysaccharide heptosyltransferase II [Blastocatellia bacterium]